MNKTELIDHFFESPMFSKWHWFSYHFGYYRDHLEHPFAQSLTGALLECELQKEGMARIYADKISLINGRENNRDDYDQLISVLAELHVIRQAMRCPLWGNNREFFHEPSMSPRGKNPEFGINSEKQYLGIEVKCPSLKDHILKRTDQPIQLPYRIPRYADFREKLGANLTLPLEKTKDFLLSADDKFAEFHKNMHNFLGILVILWDDCVYEVLGPLLNKASGLLTPNTSARKVDNGIDAPILISNVDGIIIVPHYYNLYNAPGEHPNFLPRFRDGLDYGRPNSIPPVIFVQNPSGKIVPNDILRCFYAQDYQTINWANYRVLDFIQWMDRP